MSNLIADKYGAPVQTTVAPDASPLHSMPAMGAEGASGFSPDNPMLWLVGIGAVLLGLVGFSTSGHVGPLKASVSV